MHRSFLSRSAVFTLLAGVSALIGTGTACAQGSSTTSYQISLNTTTLTDKTYTGPFALDFQFLDGNGDGLDQNNTAIVTDFMGGTNFSQATVSLADGIPSGSGESFVSFTPGSSLSFLATLTTNKDTGGAGDGFSFAITSDNAQFVTQNADGNGNGAFVTITESTDPANPGGLNLAAFDTAGTEFQPTVSAAPEPGALVTLVTGLSVLALSMTVRRLRPERQVVPVPRTG